MAELTGIEPAIFGVTGRHVNRYTTAPCSGDQTHDAEGKNLLEFGKQIPPFLLLVSSLLFFEWWAMTGSNCRHPACKAGALPAELIALCYRQKLLYITLLLLSKVFFLIMLFLAHFIVLLEMPFNNFIRNNIE